MSRFHVKKPKGEDFDIVYYDSNDDIEPLDSYPKYQKPPFMALAKTKFLKGIPHSIDESVLTPELKEEMDEYVYHIVL